MEQQMKRCPMCGEKILAVAIKCRYCGEIIGQVPKKKTPISEIVCGVIAVAIIVGFLVAAINCMLDAEKETLPIVVGFFCIVGIAVFAYIVSKLCDIARNTSRR